MLVIDLPMSSSMKKAMEKAQEKRAGQAQRRKEKREAKSEEERRRQKEKRAHAGLPEPKCSSCRQEGHLRSCSKQCLNYKPKNRVKRAAAGLTRKATIKSSLRTGCLQRNFGCRNPASCIKDKKFWTCWLSFCKFCCAPETAIRSAHPTSGSQPLLSNFWSISWNWAGRRPMDQGLIPRFSYVDASNFGTNFLFCFGDGYENCPPVPY